MNIPSEHPLSIKWKEYGDYNDSESMRKIREHWRLIPALKILPENTRKVMGIRVRMELINCLRRGIEVEGEGRRHALSPKELQLVHGNQLKLPNLYFHIGKLQEAGIITEVEVLSDGRYDTSFFGLTAKFFVHENEARFHRGVQLLTEMAESHEISNEFQKFSERVKLVEEEVVKWMEQNRSKLEGVDEVTFFLSVLDIHPSLRREEFGAKLLNDLGISISVPSDDVQDNHGYQ